MKELELKTEKGNFIMFDDAPKGDILVYKGSTYKRLFDLKKATEEQSREVVYLKGDRFQDYNHISCCDRWCNTAIKSLHSLIESKGIYLFKNPFADKIGITDFDYHRNKCEEKTFYNPTIYKKCTKE